MLTIPTTTNNLFVQLFGLVLALVQLFPSPKAALTDPVPIYRLKCFIVQSYQSLKELTLHRCCQQTIQQDIIYSYILIIF